VWKSFLPLALCISAVYCPILSSATRTLSNLFTSSFILFAGRGVGKEVAQIVKEKLEKL
jgi:hypothetical protein